MTTTPQKAEYILGTAEDEAARLGFQHQLWSDLAQRTWRDSLIGPGQTILDTINHIQQLPGVLNAALIYHELLNSEGELE